MPTRRLRGPLVVAACLYSVSIVSAQPVPWDPVFAGPAQITDFGAAARPFGIGAGDFDGDGLVDLVVGRVTGNLHFIKGNGDGTFQPPVQLPWKQTFFNGWSFGAGDVDGDLQLDLIWSANATSSGCSVSPEPAGGCGTEGSVTVTVNDGDVRAFLGNGDGTFQQTPYYVSGVLHNAGTLLADVGTDAGSLTVGDLDGDGRPDVVVGAVDGADSVVRILRNQGGGSFLVDTLLAQPSAVGGSSATPTYWPATSTQNSPWGLALGDVDDDMDPDLWIVDRALYLYLWINDGLGGFTLAEPNSAVTGRPNVYFGHDTFRAAVGYTASVGSGDINGDGFADVVLGLQSGAQTPASGVAHDGELIADVSAGGTHTGLGVLADLGTVARGVTIVDIDDDTYLDVVAAVYEGQVFLLRQLPPLDTDGDGISDYVDNAPDVANAPRLDMNADASINAQDQLDNDFDTVLGNPEEMSTWMRLGDPVDPDDDNDGVDDGTDNCPFVANADQGDLDGDTIGDGCDPLDDRDPDADGVRTGPGPGDPFHAAAAAAKLRWSSGSTHFVLRIDALSRFFQNEFTQLMMDAATLSPSEWADKCWDNYEPGDIPGYEPCGFDEGLPSQTLTLDGGREIPVTLVVIPKQLWSDPPVIAWINDRNDNIRFELGQHGAYHFNNVPASDWADQPDRNFFSCETCGLTDAENFELLRVGYDTLIGNYGNKWVAESGAQPTSPSIDWTLSANPLIAYAPPFNASDTASRRAAAWLGFRSFSASVFEENSAIFAPEGSHHETFDVFGMFHASADLELDPPDTVAGSYDPVAYESYLQSNVDDGGLTTWLIEEVEWSGRPCNDLPRLGTCNGGSNREDNTVYQPRWNAWLQLLEFVRDYPGGVVMTMGEVALANALDNCPNDPNPDQLDTDLDLLGDVCDPDDDGDGTDDAADCRPFDGTVFAEPGEVAGLAFAADRRTLSWGSLTGSAGSATTYDVLSGTLGGLPVSSAVDEQCLSSGSSNDTFDAAALPAAGEGFWYVVRGVNVCGLGSYGQTSGGDPRLSDACP